MKKFLLFAVATTMVVTASAQALSNRGQAGKAKSTVVKKLASQQKMANAPIAKPGVSTSKKKATLLNKRFSLNVSDLKNVELRRNMKTNTRRAAEVQPQYTGMASVAGNGKSPWTMLSGSTTTEEGATITLLADVIPNPYPDNFDYIPVEYTLSGNTITIAPQSLFSSAEWTAFIFSGTSEDAAITMTLGEDGSLTLPEGEQIFYGAFPTETFDPTFESYLGYIENASKIRYLLPGQIAAPQVEYNPAGLYLYVNTSKSGYGYTSATFAMLPAYTSTSLINATTDLADAWQWNFDQLTYNQEESKYDVVASQTATTRDFSVQTTPGFYNAAQLIGSYQNASSEPFVLGAVNSNTESYISASDMQDNYDFSDGTYAMITCANPDNEIARYTSFSTPDVNTVRQISSFVLYQGKPDGPLYMEGINMFVGNMNIKDPANFTLKCKLQKVTRDKDGWPLLGDVIAEADLYADDVEVGYSGNVTITELYWKNFYVEDEDGMTESIDYLFLEDEFAIIIDGWDNGTFSCDYIWGEYNSNNSAPYPTYYFSVGDEKIDENMYRSNYNCYQLVGFVGAIYGYLYTQDNTNITIPTEGGVSQIHVNPMLYSTDENDQPAVRLFIESIVVDGEEAEELPEWLSIGFANMDFSTRVDYDLVFQAEPLPAGVESRQVNLVFFQEGAQLKVTVTQGATSIKGDVNGDGQVGIGDIICVTNYMAGHPGEITLEQADVNGDGEVGIGDIISITNIMAGTVTR